MDIPLQGFTFIKTPLSSLVEGLLTLTQGCLCVFISDFPHLLILLLTFRNYGQDNSEVYHIFMGTMYGHCSFSIEQVSTRGLPLLGSLPGPVKV